MNSDLPAAPATVPNFTGGELRFIVLLWLIPFLPLVAFAINWGSAWHALGHIPRPKIDDPNEISRLCSVLYSTTAIVILLTVPAMIFASLRYLAAWGATLRSLLVLAICWGMTVGAFMALDKFPHNALAWWID